MSDLLKIFVTVIFAIPFIYMFYDVARDIIGKTYILITKKAKPALATIISTLFN